MLSNNAIEYTIKNYMEIVGIDNDSYILHNNTVYIDDYKIVFNILDQKEQKKILEGSLIPQYISSFDNKIKLPIWGNSEFCKWENKELLIKPDIITISFILLSRYEEFIFMDEESRFSFDKSINKKFNIIDFPIIDEYAFLIRNQIGNTKLKTLIKRKNPAVYPTHDVDLLYYFDKTFIKALKKLVYAIVKEKINIFGIINLIKDFIITRFDSQKDPNYSLCEKLMKLSHKCNMQSTFYFLGYNKDNEDYRYNVNENNAKILIKKLQEGDCVLGYHCGIGTSVNLKEHILQKENVAKAIGDEPKVIRQHYLQFNPKITPEIWECSKIEKDQTLGFFDREGFRCGTSHSFYMYDLNNDKVLNVIEQPLIVMDGTLMHYRNFNISEALEAVKKIRERCFLTEGNFVVLWHNKIKYGKQTKWYKDFYIRILEDSYYLLVKNNN